MPPVWPALSTPLLWPALSIPPPWPALSTPLSSPSSPPRTLPLPLQADPEDAFKLDRQVLTEAARSFVHAPATADSDAFGVGDPTVPSGLALLEVIASTCKRAGIPPELLADPAFSFLT